MPPPVVDDLLPLPGQNWCPTSHATVPALATLLESEILSRSGSSADDPDGANNYWPPTMEWGARWKTSRLKWKWRCKVRGVEELLGASPVRDDDDGDEEGRELLLSLLRVADVVPQTLQVPDPKVEEEGGEVPEDFFDYDAKVESSSPSYPAAKKMKFNFGLFMASRRNRLSTPITPPPPFSRQTPLPEATVSFREAWPRGSGCPSEGREALAPHGRLDPDRQPNR